MDPLHFMSLFCMETASACLGIIGKTLLELGSDLMKPSNAYYKSMQMVVQKDIPNAKPINADLKVWYEQKPKKKENGSES